MRGWVRIDGVMDVAVGCMSDAGIAVSKIHANKFDQSISQNVYNWEGHGPFTV